MPGTDNKDNKEKKHVCSICGKPSDLTICHACEDKIRGEAVEKKHEAEKVKK